MREYFEPKAGMGKAAETILAETGQLKKTERECVGEREREGEREEGEREGKREGER